MNLAQLVSLLRAVSPYRCLIGLFVLGVVGGGLLGPDCTSAQSSDPLEDHFSTLIGTQSPTATSLGKYGDVPVSLYRGTPEITVPLLKVKSRTQELPIRLRYDASGVKVGELASWVGQNWTLEAGGAITRTVRSQPDGRGYLDSNRDSIRSFLDAHGYDQVSAFQENDDVPYGYRDGMIFDSAYRDYVEKAAGLDRTPDTDTEPDLFFFNAAGLSGQFVLPESAGQGPAHTQVVITSRGTPVKIEYELATVNGIQVIDAWTLWAPDGTVYEFEAKEKTRTLDYKYTSAWYLTEILRPEKAKSSITLQYTSPPDVGAKQPSDTTVSRTESLDGQYQEGTDEVDECPLNVFEETYNSFEGRNFNIYLDRIETDQMRVDFVSSPGDQARQDLVNADTDASKYRRLEAVEVKRKGSGGQYKLVKKFDPSYGYFSRSGTETRLRLEELQERASTSTVVGEYRFQYAPDSNTTAVDSPPRYSSSRIDHWGYYNGGGSGLLPDNTSREPDQTETKSGILTGITYPTGGTTRFEYEAHRYDQIIDPNTDLSYPDVAGGLRIEKIISDPKAGSPPSVKRFEYKMEDGSSSGVLLAEPVYEHELEFGVCYDQ